MKNSTQKLSLNVAVAHILNCSCFLSIITYNYNATILTSYYCNLVTFQTVVTSYKLLRLTSYITSYFYSS